MTTREQELEKAAATTVDEVRAIGQRYRDDWSDFDGRTLKAELIDATTALHALLDAPSPSSEQGERTETLTEEVKEALSSLQRSAIRHGEAPLDDDAQLGLTFSQMTKAIAALESAILAYGRQQKEGRGT